MMFCLLLNLDRVEDLDDENWILICLTEGINPIKI